MGFQQGLSGLDAASKALAAVSNNVANSGTVGFKASSAEFSDVFAASLAGTGGSQVGIGTKVSGIVQEFTQGNITTTANPLDFAINGNGLFRMDNNGAITYTRNGQFQVDKNGYVVSANGYKLTGYPVNYTVNSTGIITQSQPVPIFIDPSDLQPKATGAVQVGANLDSRSTVPLHNTATDTTFNAADPLSYTSSTSVTINDSLGNPHVMSMYFVKTGVVGGWNVHTTMDGLDMSTPTPLATPAGAPPAVLTPATVGNIAIAGTPSVLPLTFNTSGVLTSPATAPSFSVDLNAVMWAQGGVTNNAVAKQTFTINFQGSTQFGSPFGVNNLVQDGFTSGRLAGLNVSADGVILGRYTNGQSRNLAQIVLAKFNNPNGLSTLGGNQWAETAASGVPIVGAPSTGGNGSVQSAAQEDSTVDLTAELVNMITQQRAYQANAQSIKTEDQLMQTLVNLR